MSDLLLATKTHIPTLRSQLVNRPHLIGLLNEGVSQNNRLMLISAPAGYGKSTLLAEWVSQLKCAVAWLTLEKAENTPIRFWSYFVSALQTIPSLSRAEVGRLTLHTQQSSDSTGGDSGLAALVNDLSGLDEQVVFVLDDLHTITNAEIHEGLVFLVEHIPASNQGFHLVVAGRIDPPWPLARLRARAQITELRSRDLQFNLDEATAFLNRVMGLRLSASDVSRLDQRTEGWVAGLQMAALSMQNRDDIPTFIERFSGSHRYILDYLIEEVLSQQSLQSMDFLLKTSILDLLSAPLCDAVTRGQGSQERLIQLERSNVFLSCLDDEQHWYRYHPLFGDLLRKRLRTDYAAQVPELHRRASEWYEENGFLRDCIMHALDAEDMKGVARLVSGNILVLAEGEALPELLNRIRPLQSEDIRSRPWLCIAVAWVKAYAGQLDEAEALVHEVETASSGQMDEKERSHLIGHAMTIRAYTQWIRGLPEAAVEIASEALARVPDDDALEKANILIILGLASQNSLNILQAIQAFKEAVSFSLEASNRYLQIYALSCQVFALRLSGQLHQAYETCESAIRSAEQDRPGQGSFPLAVGLAARSEVRLQWNDLKGALEDAQRAVTLAEQWRQADTLHYTLSVLTNTCLALRDFDSCRRLIERSKWIASKVSPWFMEISERQEAELNLACGNWDEVLRWKQSASGARIIGFSDISVLGNILMAKRHYSEAITVLDEGIIRLEGAGIWGALLDLYVLKTLALSALGQTEKALSILEIVLKMAEPEGYTYGVVSQGKPMAKLLHLAVRRGIHQEYAQRLLNIMTEGRPQDEGVDTRVLDVKTEPGMEIIEPLSDRELEVLRLLNTQLSVPEIAQELTVAPSTVRTHVRVIYGKLNAHGRLEAIHRAKALALI